MIIEMYWYVASAFTIGVFVANFVNGVRYGNYYRKENNAAYEKWLNGHIAPRSTMYMVYVSGEIIDVAFGCSCSPITTVTTLTAISLFKACMYGLTMPIMLPKMVFDLFNGDGAVHIYPYYHRQSMAPLYQKMMHIDHS